jgi:Fur family transcriptional regulator, ferric uptake regulator
MNTFSTVSRSEVWLEELQVSGYRITKPLQVIVEILTNASRALQPVDIFDMGRSKYPKMGLVTVYRALEKLTALGLVQRVHQEDGCHAYLRAADGHEHILLCTRCGRAVFFTGDDISELVERVAQQSGFDIQEHWLQLSGLCAKCQLTFPQALNARQTQTGRKGF